MTREEFEALLNERARADIEEPRAVEIHGAIATAYASQLAQLEQMQRDLERTRELLNQSRDANHIMYSQLHAQKLETDKPKPEEKVRDLQETVTIDQFLRGGFDKL